MRRFVQSHVGSKGQSPEPSPGLIFILFTLPLPGHVMIMFVPNFQRRFLCCLAGGESTTVSLFPYVKNETPRGANPKTAAWIRWRMSRGFPLHRSLECAPWRDLVNAKTWAGKRNWERASRKVWHPKLTQKQQGPWTISLLKTWMVRIRFSFLKGHFPLGKNAKSACLQGCQWSEQNPFLFAAISPAHLSLRSSCQHPGSTTELITRRRQAFLRLLPFKSWEYWPLQTKFSSLLLFLSHGMACGILVLQPGTEPVLPALTIWLLGKSSIPSF